MLERASGVLLHISSLPGPFGIGTLGDEAYRFVDQLAETKTKYWQILPLNPTGPANSPYASTSCFANNMSFIDPRILAGEKYLKDEEISDFYCQSSPHKADFGFTYENSRKYLKLAYSRITAEQRHDMLAFVNSEQAWINDYALFSVLHKHFDYRPWQEWEDGLNHHDERAISRVLQDERFIEEIEFYYFCQWQFRRQWDNLRAYANSKDVYLIGDMPIFPALDSADVWANPELFQLDEKGWPEAVAGVPPDYFSLDGQLWGNPLYDWDYNANEDYRWWVKRTRYQMDLYDIIRIDHFRGFDSYWAIPYGSKTAVHGVWRKGPGIALFETLEREIENLSIIAEDLGDITESVEELIQDTGYPGMKILTFSLDKNDWAKNRPFTFGENAVVYTGTHDNSTVYGWLEQLSEEDRQFALDYVRMPALADWREGGAYSPAVRAFVETIWALPCVIAIAPMQDLLGYGEGSRMNTPGTLSQDNWAFRLTGEEMYRLDTNWLYRMNKVFQRLARNEDPKPIEEEAKYAPSVVEVLEEMRAEESESDEMLSGDRSADALEEASEEMLEETRENTHDEEIATDKEENLVDGGTLNVARVKDLLEEKEIGDTDA